MQFSKPEAESAANSALDFALILREIHNLKCLQTLKVQSRDALEQSPDWNTPAKVSSDAQTRILIQSERV